MEDDSFDPRNWGKAKPDKPSEPSAPDQSPPRERTHIPEMWRDVGSAGEDLPAAEAPGPGDALPDMWRDVSEEAGIAAPSRTEQEAVSGGTRTSRTMLAASAALLLAGMAGAWATRAPVESPDSNDQSAQSTPRSDPALVERAFNLASAQELIPAMVGVGVPEDEALAIAKAALSGISASGEIKARIAMRPLAQGGFTVQRLQASYIDGSGAVVSRGPDGSFVGTAIAAELTDSIQVVSGELDSTSFYSSAVAAGIQDAMIPEFINAFAYDFNLAADINPGDTFEVAYQQQLNAEGEAVGRPELLFASLTTPEKSRQLYRFKDAAGAVGWYDGNGASVKRGLMRTPVDGARLTSKFGMRFHPVKHYNRLHGGIDLAAPVGAAIFAAADGTVTFAAMKGCNGNLTVIDHGNGIETFYLHQNRFMPGIAPGAHVTQGQHIGDVGQTPSMACVTGPHLHFEVHVSGEKVDPLTVTSLGEQRKTLAGPDLQAFVNERNRVDTARAGSSY